jgi:hypothetical protein
MMKHPPDATPKDVRGSYDTRPTKVVNSAASKHPEPHQVPKHPTTVKAAPGCQTCC